MVIADSGAGENNAPDSSGHVEVPVLFDSHANESEILFVGKKAPNEDRQPRVEIANKLSRHSGDFYPDI